MQQITLAETAAYLENSTIELTHDAGHALVLVGRNASGVIFVMVNDNNGNTAITEAG